MSTILRAIYFLRIPLLEAVSNPGASFTWRSILGGIQLLKRGLEWQISSGTQVRVWEDCWLPRDRKGQPTYHYPGMDSFQFVSDFIQEEPRA